MSRQFADRHHRLGGGRWRQGVGCLLALVIAGCNTSDMRDQPRYDPLEPSELFADHRSSRPLIEGTVARGQLRTDHHFFEGRVDGELATTFPEPLSIELLRRGQQQFGIFCTPCHGEVGFGDGMAVQRGYPRPPSFHTARLRDQPVGYLYDVITNGYGRMMDYREQVRPADRWAIVAYIRALQRSQYTTRQELSPSDLDALERAKATPPGAENTSAFQDPAPGRPRPADEAAKTRFAAALDPADPQIER